MFDIGAPEVFVLAVVALFVFGPDRLPDMARQAGRALRGLRRAATGARQQISAELGPEFADMRMRDLDPRVLVRRHVLAGLDEDDEPPPPPTPAPRRPLALGELPPFDPDAT